MRLEAKSSLGHLFEALGQRLGRMPSGHPALVVGTRASLPGCRDVCFSPRPRQALVVSGRE